MNLTEQEYADMLIAQYAPIALYDKNGAITCALIDVQNTIDVLERCAESLKTEDLDNAIVYFLQVKRILEGMVNN